MTAETRNPDQLRPHPLNDAVYGTEPIDPAFRESIEAEGILTPLTIDQDDTIISGHRRWRVAQAMGLSYVPVVVREIYDPLDAERWLIESNRQREKTTSQVHREADELERIIGAQAQSRMVEGGRRGGAMAGRARPMVDPIGVPPIGGTPIPEPDTPDGERVETVKRVAEMVGKRTRTFERERHVWNVAQGRRGDPPEVQSVAQELVKKLDQKQITPSRAEMELRDVEKRTESHAGLPPRQHVVTEAEQLETVVLGADAAINDGGVAKHALLRELGRDVRGMLASYKEDDVCAAFARHPDMDHIFTDLHRLRRFIANVERRCAVIVGGKGRVG